MTSETFAALLPWLAVGVVILFDVVCLAFLAIVAAFMTGLGTAGRTVLAAAGLSLTANAIVGGHALWLGSRGVAPLAWIGGHMAAVLVVGIALAGISDQPSSASPSMRERAWIRGPAAAAWALAIVAIFAALSLDMLSRL